ncbi:MAG: hypothetical protein VB021_07575 [Oscillospiraceae bacterium]|nr:hypothetical protein [Oscillospiraceae bacterium]
MKGVGCCFIVAAFFVLGRIRKARLLDGARILEQLILLCGEMRYAMTFTSASLLTSLRDFSLRESFSRLGFLGGALRRLGAAGTLRQALLEALGEWDGRELLTREELSVLTGLFDNFAGESADRETEKLSLACARLSQALEVRRADRRTARGYYELLYTLAGAVLAVVLF